MQQHNKNGVRIKIKVKPAKKGPINTLTSAVFVDNVELTDPMSPAIKCLVNVVLTKRIGTHQY